MISTSPLPQPASHAVKRQRDDDPLLLLEKSFGHDQAV